MSLLASLTFIIRTQQSNSYLIWMLGVKTIIAFLNSEILIQEILIFLKLVSPFEFYIHKSICRFTCKSIYISVNLTMNKHNRTIHV